jgi:hypothetical protein
MEVSIDVAGRRGKVSGSCGTTVGLTADECTAMRQAVATPESGLAIRL